MKTVTFKKSGSPFYPDEPQPKEYYIGIIKDKTIKRYLTDGRLKPFSSYPKSHKKGYLFRDVTRFFMEYIEWESSPQGVSFWDAIYKYFSANTGGLKTYKDFKHLDKSVKRK